MSKSFGLYIKLMLPKPNNIVTCKPIKCLINNVDPRGLDSDKK